MCGVSNFGITTSRIFTNEFHGGNSIGQGKATLFGGRREYILGKYGREQVQRCKEWEYDRSIMKDSVVTQWDRVCDDNWSRAHVHLSYSLGYLIGCLMGGFISVCVLFHSIN
jgi:hypothetical protein